MPLLLTQGCLRGKGAGEWVLSCGPLVWLLHSPPPISNWCGTATSPPLPGPSAALLPFGAQKLAVHFTVRRSPGC